MTYDDPDPEKKLWYDRTEVNSEKKKSYWLGVITGIALSFVLFMYGVVFTR
jgi:hypothetical protein